MMSLCAEGTALGDPIEAGAATAVLRGGRLALRLSAAKSQFGHAEPAAGSIGLVHAAAQLASQICHPITALTAINPYVVGSLAELKPAGQLAPHILRQAAASVVQPLAEEAGLQAATGVSAFAFQGTNAHALLGHSLDARPAAGSNKEHSLWHHQRFWYAPPQHHMLQHCVVEPQSGSIAVQCQLSSASLAYICDHQVRTDCRCVSELVCWACVHLTTSYCVGSHLNNKLNSNTDDGVSSCAGARPHPLPGGRHACNVAGCGKHPVRSGQRPLGPGGLQH